MDAVKEDRQTDRQTGWGDRKRQTSGIIFFNVYMFALCQYSFNGKKDRQKQGERETGDRKRQRTDRQTDRIRWRQVT